MKFNILFYVSVFLATLNCQLPPDTTASDQKAGDQKAREPLNTASNSDALVAHEWGTFTSMSGSDGKLLEGMHHEEEPLPEFVYGRNTEAAPRPKGVEGDTGAPIEEVTQKLETPVIYFYGAKASAAQVVVDFPNGIISEWFPQATKSSPELGRQNLLKDGHMEWNVTFDALKREFPSVPEQHLWAHSRRVDSRPLRAGKEHEQFIFYRGLGRFQTPFQVKTRLGGQILLENGSAQDIPAAFLLVVSKEGGTLRELGPVPARSTRTDVFSPRGGKEHPMEAFVAQTEFVISRSLVASGLFEDEANAMVKTWSHSYFRTAGTRILYVVPRAWTDELLPLNIQPTPKETVRVLVGRTEILSVEEETELVSRAERAAAENLAASEFNRRFLPTLGRFAEPKIRRALALKPSAKASKLLESALAEASLAP